MSKVPETAPTSFVIVELARPPRQAFRFAFGHPCPVSDLFGVAGRKLFDRLELPEPWRGNLDASLLLMDELERQVAEINRELRRIGSDHPYTSHF